MDVVNIQLLRATSADARIITDIFHDSWPLSAPSLTSSEKEDFLSKQGVRYWKRELEDGDGLCSILYLNDEPLGFTFVRHDEDGGGELDRLFLKDCARGQGLGEILFTEALRLLDLLQVDFYFLWVIDDNVAAQHFYARHGWASTSEVKQLGPVRWIKWQNISC